MITAMTNQFNPIFTLASIIWNLKLQMALIRNIHLSPKCFPLSTKYKKDASCYAKCQAWFDFVENPQHKLWHDSYLKSDD